MKRHVKQVKSGLRCPSRPTRRPRLALGFVVAAVGWAVVYPSGSYARVNPLVIIERQIHKANMLIVLDTSGSMTGVPGGAFSSATEAGVDCKNGVNCKASGIQAACRSSGHICMTDADCRVGHCTLTSAVTCSADTECPAIPSKCSLTGDTCSETAPCPGQPSTCSATGVTCDGTHPCAAYATCKYGGAVCTNPGGQCAAAHYCQKDLTKSCTTDAECPQSSSGGNCAAGGTPPSGCSTQEDCPVRTRCETTDETCQGAEDCPGPSKGRCSDNGDTCTNNHQCNDGATCVYWTNACVGPTNPCILPHSKCDSIPSSHNDCIAQTNTCTAHPNTCVSPGSNTCDLPDSSTDTCEESNHGPPGPIRMCAQAMTVCNNNGDCPAGDSCGAATSRMMIAKQAINSLVSKNYDTVNFGLMTFYQSGYFPYYPATSGAPPTTVTVFEDHDKLVANGCFTEAWGPTPTCTIAGTSLTLQRLQNSLYTVPTGPGTSVPANQNYCGLICEIRPNIGTGLYEGSYYTYSGASGNTGAEASVQPSYAGKDIKISGVDHTYYEALTNYYSGGTPPPFTFTNCEVTKACGPRCGGRWDANLAPFIDTSDNPAVAHNNALLLAKSLEPASYGGLMAFWSTPTGCTLENTETPTVNTSAYHYMQTVIDGDVSLNVSPDPLRCRANYVMLVTDGAANGPGDIDAENNSVCAVDACAAADPVAAGCTCRSVLAAWHLRQNLGVKTFVVGFSGDAARGTISEIINDNIARAGGTDSGDDGVAPFAYLAQNDTELATALQLAVLSAIKGSYSTAPTSSSAGTQQATTVAEGRYALDSRMDFPEWKGHLFAYDLQTAATPCVNDPDMLCPTIVWDAYTMLQRMDWKTRRIYTWDGTNMVKFQVASDGSITNQAALAALGLGSTEEEAGRAARWALGDPSYGNQAVLGAIVNSTPIDIASPGDVPQPGGHDFFLAQQNRPHLVYVGSSDGMLHAFFLETTRVGTTTYLAGTEAFAFVPPEMLAVIRRQYVQGGQRPSPYDHIFGIADSPKAKSLCVSGCSDAATAVWKTLLLQTEGYGGSESFVLDVTSPFSAAGLADPPVRVQWHSDFGTHKAAYDAALGQTVSLPAFLFNKTDARDDYRLIFTSGYPVTSGSDTQGRKLITALARNGTIATEHTLSPNPSCSLEYTNLTDVATARDFARDQADKLLAGYFGDTHGQLWRYRLGGTPSVAMDFGCSHPLHFAPTVVQLDRDSFATSHAHEIYPVQVTNSSLDFDSNMPPLTPSKMVFWKEVATTDDGGNIVDVARDLTWNDGVGKIELTVGVDAEICGVTETDTHGHVTCKESMPLSARPTATPLGLLKSDASGFQVFTMWYAPSADSCNKGQTYFAIHEASAGGAVTQKVGAAVAAEPVTSPVVMHGQVLLFGAAGSYDITALSPSIISPGRALPPGAPGTTPGQFQRYNWTEIMQ
jgi:hypothetical protein